MNELSADFLEEIIDMAVEEVMNIVSFLSESMLAGGRVFGDVDVKGDGETIARYVDMAQSGVMTMLPVVNPDLAASEWRRFDGAMGRQIEQGAI